jgi:hypothetical protein
MEQLVQPHCMVQVGVRSPVERAVHDWTHDQGVVMSTAQDVHEQSPIAVADRIRQVIGDEPVYFSCDIDVLDPAFAPGTGTPEISGLASWQVQAIMPRLRGLQIHLRNVVGRAYFDHIHADYRARGRDHGMGISFPARWIKGSLTIASPSRCGEGRVEGSGADM